MDTLVEEARATLIDEHLDKLHPIRVSKKKAAKATLTAKHRRKKSV